MGWIDGERTVFYPDPQALGGIKTAGGSTVGNETETPKASRGGEWGCLERGIPPPQPTRRSGGASSAPPAGSGAEPRPKTNLVHSRAVRKPLVAIILSVFKCMFYTTYRLD